MTVHAIGSRPHRCTCKPLNDTELRMLVLAANGADNARIAESLSYARDSVSSILYRARKKMGGATPEQLLASAFRHRLIGFGPNGDVVAVEAEAS